MEPLRFPARGLVLTPTPLARQPVSWVVLLHGLPQNCACWTWVLATLAAARSRSTRALAPPGALSAALAWHRAARRFSLRASGAGADAECVGSGHPALVAARGHHDRALGDRRPPVRGPCRRRPDDPIQVSDSRLVQRVAGHRPATGQILPAGAAVTVLIGSRGRTACTRQMLRFRDQAIAPVEYPTSASASVRGRDGGRNQAGSEPGGAPPKPPGATPRDRARLAAGGTHRRARRETGAAAPGFVPGRYSQAAVLS
jgi:hypothetical protein